MSTAQWEESLKKYFKAARITLEDESWKHASHVARKQEGQSGHYKILIVSDLFEGMPLLQRHRKVYNAFEELGIGSHALSISAFTRSEWASKSSGKSNPKI